MILFWLSMIRCWLLRVASAMTLSMSSSSVEPWSGESIRGRRVVKDLLRANAKLTSVVCAPKSLPINITCMRAMLRAVTLTVLTAACSQSFAPVPYDGASYWPGANWRTAQPSQVGLDGRTVTGLVGRIRRGDVPFINSLVIVRQGYLVVEEYFNGSSRADVHTMQSVSK